MRYFVNHESIIPYLKCFISLILAEGDLDLYYAIILSIIEKNVGHSYLYLYLLMPDLCLLTRIIGIFRYY